MKLAPALRTLCVIVTLQGIARNAVLAFLGEIALPLPILIAVILFLVCGSPGKIAADSLWQNDAAPWEKVDAFYYPDKADLSDFKSVRDLGSVQECRDSVLAMAAANGDPGLARGDYECGIGKIKDFGGVGMYRLTTR